MENSKIIEVAKMFPIAFQKLGEFLKSIYNDNAVLALNILGEFEYRDLTEIGVASAYLYTEGGLFKVLADRLNKKFEKFIFVKDINELSPLVSSLFSDEFAEEVGGILMGCIMASSQPQEKSRVLH